MEIRIRKKRFDAWLFGENLEDNMRNRKEKKEMCSIENFKNCEWSTLLIVSGRLKNIQFLFMILSPNDESCGNNSQGNDCDEK